MKSTRATRSSETMPPPATWWYTLAHANTHVRGLALSGAALDELIASLEARDLPIASPLRNHERLRSHSALAHEGLRYLWAFRRMRDALTAARANHCSNYHSYPQPRSLHEDSLDRLYRRFPLRDFPQTTIVLISGAFVCDDPLLGPDPTPHSLAAMLPGAIASDEWARYTLCGFERGTSLVTALPSDRWLRVTFSEFEDAWAIATLQAQREAQRETTSSLAIEQAALDYLLRDQSDETLAFVGAGASPHKRGPTRLSRISISA